jgi:signal transduction histidine kinase
MSVGIDELPEKRFFRPGEGLTGRVLKTGKAMTTGDYAEWSGSLPGWTEKIGHAAMMAIPINWGERVLGVLEVMGPTPQTFSRANTDLLKSFATQAAIAIRNVRLQEDLREHAEQLEKMVATRTAELQTERAQLEAILQSITDGIMVMDGGGECIHINAVAQTWLNQTLTLEDAEKLRSTVHMLASTAEEEPETILELKGLDLELQAAPIISTELKQGAAVVVMHDVTHLQAVNRMKSQFVSNISHELRTPLTTIKLYTQMMIQKPNKQRDYAALIEEEVNHQISLVEQILQISQLDAGRLEITPQPTPVNELAEIAIGNHDVLAENKRLKLVYQPCSQNPIALVDPRHAIVVVNNLLRNAIQYTGDGGEIRVSTSEQETANRRWATITVEDNGMGIPKDELPQIFERFYRGDRPRTMQISGNGLGLAIVKEIVELHGGQVTVRSQVKKGSAFTVWFPQTRPY